MRKIDKKFCAWMMAGVITVGAMAGGGIAPAQVWASAEKQEEGQKAEKATDEKTEKDAVEGTVRPSDYVLQPQESYSCLLYTSPSPRDRTRSRMPSSA